jgi:hypothetical protein
MIKHLQKKRSSEALVFLKFKVNVQINKSLRTVFIAGILPSETYFT